MLVHGMNCRDERPIFYWGRIPDTLRGHGATVYLGGQDAWGSVAGNARQLRETALRILEEEGCGKINLIAHSKGGLEARCLISQLGMAEHIASLTTLSTPHRGTRTAQWIREQKLLVAPYGVFSNRFWRLLGDKEPHFRQTMLDISADEAEVFNRECPDVPGVFYQSWGARLSGTLHDPLMTLYAAVCRPLDGETDGLVSPESAMWGQYRGTLERVGHQELADAMRRDLPHFKPLEFYMDLVRELAEKGF